MQGAKEARHYSVQLYEKALDRKLSTHFRSIDCIAEPWRNGKFYVVHFPPLYIRILFLTNKTDPLTLNKHEYLKWKRV